LAGEGDHGGGLGGGLSLSSASAHRFISAWILSSREEKKYRITKKKQKPNPA
jgi:hypothetical protein